jgi:hypothetical protein
MELSFHNRLYGHGTVLKRYTKLPAFIPFPFTVQHGWLGGRRLESTNSEFRSPLRTIWAWSETSAASYREHHDAVHVGGAPFLYLIRSILPIRDNSDTAKGTIVFPYHGTRHIEVQSDLDRYAQSLHELPPQFRPVRVCVHPEDLRMGLDAPFRTRGLRVFTNGAGNDASFLYRFVRNAAQVRYATSNHPCTALLYAAHLGARIFLWGPPISLRNVSSDEQPRGALSARSAVVDEMRANLSLDRLENHDYQQALCARELGTRFLSSPEELRRLVLREYRHPLNYWHLAWAVAGKARRTATNLKSSLCTRR